MKADMTQKVITSLNTHLEHNDTVNISDILMRLSWLQEAHIQQWKQRFSETLIELIQCAPQKWQRACLIFKQEVDGMEYIDAPWMSYSLINKDKQLTVLSAANKDIEDLFCRHYLKKGISARKKTSIKNKISDKPENCIFIKTSADNNCDQCGSTIMKRDFIYTEANKAYCLKCVKLDKLAFLASGNATLSRRARKHSRKFAVVVEFNKRRKRYERRGILVEKAAIEAAEMECGNDAGKRAVAREKSTVKRIEEDCDFTAKFLFEIKQYFPKCPLYEVEAIAKHATVRSSGRVGRTAAAKKFDEEMIRLAVIAYIRHQHTDYDSLLLNRTPKQMARKLIQLPLQKKLSSWE